LRKKLTIIKGVKLSKKWRFFAHWWQCCHKVQNKGGVEMRGAGGEVESFLVCHFFILAGFLF